MMFNSPKNFKRGRFISNRYRRIDLVFAGVGTLISIVMLLTYLLALEGKSIVVICVLMVPAVVTTTLIMPMNVYHNLLEFLKLLIIYNNSRKVYIWEGVYKEDIINE